MDKEPGDGGLARHVTQLMNGLSENGYDVALMRISSPNPVDNHQITRQFRLKPSYGLAQGLALIAQLNALLKDYKPDIIHLHGCFTCISPVLLRKLRIYGPVVGTIHDVRHFCYLMTRRFGPTAKPCQRRCGVGCFTSGCVRPSRFTDFPRLARRWLVDRLSLEQWRLMNRVIVPSRYMKELALQHGFTDNCLRIISHGVDAPSSIPGNFATEAASPPLILFMGSLISYKGAHLLIDALNLLKDQSWEAIFIGDGPERMVLEQQTKDAGLAGRIVFHGYIQDRIRIDALLFRARMLVLPSTIPESFALSGVEALALGTPVISFGLGGVTEWLDDNSNGLIARDLDTQDLANKIERLLNEPEMAKLMGLRGRKLVADHFNLSRCIEQTCELYDTLATTNQH